MLVYRIQHTVSGLGPFQHKEPGKRYPNQNTIGSSVRSTRKAFEDIDHLPEVKKLLRKHKGKVLFAFSKEEDIKNAVIDKVLLQLEGFEIKQLEVEPLFISDNGTVLFLRKGNHVDCTTSTSPCFYMEQVRWL